MSEQIIRNIQKIHSELTLSNYSNLGKFVTEIDANMEKILTIRLEDLIDIWINEFESWPNAGTTLIVHGSLHEFKVQNQVS